MPADQSISDTELGQLRSEVTAASELLEFALTSAAAVAEPTDDRKTVPRKVIETIQDMQHRFATGTWPELSEVLQFRLAYRDLSFLMSPVTAQTLRDTCNARGRTSRLFARKDTRSEAVLWSRTLWLITIVVLLILIVSENLNSILQRHFPIDEDDPGPWMWVSLDSWLILNTVLQNLGKFTYGALGACVYLLRSCHVFIRRREFSRDRIPEYLSRLLLGIVSGGAVLLIADQISTEEGNITISEATLAFLAGYNSDFFFRALERVAEALLPKIGIESLRRATNSARTPTEATVKELLDRLSETTDADQRRFLMELVSKLTLGTPAASSGGRTNR